MQPPAAAEIRPAFRRQISRRLSGLNPGSGSSRHAPLADAGKRARGGPARRRSPRGSSPPRGRDRMRRRIASRGAATGAGLLDGRICRPRSNACARASRPNEVVGTRDGPGSEKFLVAERGHQTAPARQASPSRRSNRRPTPRRPARWRGRRRSRNIAVGFSVPRPASGPGRGRRVSIGVAAERIAARAR